MLSEQNKVYRQTEIGLIPGAWECVQTKTLFANHSSKNHPNEELLSVTQDKGVIPRDMLDARVTMPEGDTSNFKLVEPGDFVISLRSFQGGIELSNYSGLVSPAYTVLRKSVEMEQGFYKHLFKSTWFINRLSSAVIGIRDGKQISYSVFSELFVPKPPLPEQRKITTILKSVDDAITATQRIIDQTERVKRGLMQQLFTKGIGHTTFKQTEIGEIPTEWDVVKLDDIIDLIGGQSSPASEVNVDGLGTPYVTGPEQWNGSHSEEVKWVENPRKIAPKDSFYITVKGSGTGKVFPGGEYAIGRDIMAISAKGKTSTQFLYHVVTHRAGEIIKHKVGMVPGISRPDILEYSIGLPAVNEQEKIATIIDAYDRKIQIEKASHSQLKDLKQSLLQVLLTGKVHVNVDEPAEVSV